MKIDIEKAKQAFKEYVKNYDQEDKQVKLKIEHIERAGQNPSHRRMQRPDRTDLSRLPRRQKTRRDHQKRPINT